MTTVQDIEKIVCHQCFAVLDVGDRFCRHCGVPLSDQGAPAPPVARNASAARVVSHGRNGEAKWSENRWVVLAVLLFVAGPLGLPMLWRSRQFSPAWKATLTLLMVGITALILGLIWYVFYISLKPLVELQQLKGLSLLTCIIRPGNLD
jgi:hypothetical protein